MLERRSSAASAFMKADASARLRRALQRRRVALKRDRPAVLLLARREYQQSHQDHVQGPRGRGVQGDAPGRKRTAHLLDRSRHSATTMCTRTRSTICQRSRMRFTRKPHPGEGRVRQYAANRRDAVPRHQLAAAPVRRAGRFGCGHRR